MPGRERKNYDLIKKERQQFYDKIWIARKVPSSDENTNSSPNVEALSEASECELLVETGDIGGHTLKLVIPSHGESHNSQSSNASNETFANSLVGECNDDVDTQEMMLIDRGNSSNSYKYDQDHDNFDNYQTNGKASTVPLTEELKSWYNNHNVPLSSFKTLLQILGKYHPNLPKDPRTILNTKTFEYSSIGDGFFAYFGLEKCIIDNFSPDTVFTASSLDIVINIDGVPIHKSTATSFWPILITVSNCNGNKPFIIGIYSGPKKPNVNSFLDEFCLELASILNEGIIIRKILYSVNVRAIVVDAPAKAFVKQIKTHGGYSACDRCVIKGKYDQVKRTMSYYEEVASPLRNNVDFRTQTYSDHHVGISPFVVTPLDMIGSFPVDYMHAILLGVMRKLMNAWLNVVPFKLSTADKKIVNMSIDTIRKYIPDDFNRKPRHLSEFERYKATEFRTYLLYIGISVFYGVIKDEYFNHFSILFVAIRILSDPDCVTNEANLDYADKLLKLFIHQFQSLYHGRYTVVYNVHMLTHIADDCRRLGPLDSFSAFQFENVLGMIKRRVRSSHLPLSQITRRISEGFTTNCGVSGDQTDSPSSIYVKGRKLKIGSFKNSCVILNDFSIGIVCSVLPNSQLMLKKFVEKETSLTYPCNFNLINVYCVSKKICRKIVDKSSLYKKCMIYPHKNGYLVLPLV